MTRAQVPGQFPALRVRQSRGSQGRRCQAGFGSFDSLNPFINKGVAADDIGLIYDTLTTNSLDEPFTVYGLLAEKIEKGPNNSWVRFHLRPQARFHDGEPVTADDVVFTFETLMSKGAPHYRGYYADVEKVVAESPRGSLRLQARRQPRAADDPRPAAGAAEALVGGARIHLGQPGNPAGQRPVPRREGPGRALDPLCPVEDYWGKDLPVNRGFYNFDHVNFDYYRDNTVALQAFKAGHFDYWFETSAKNWATAYDIAAVRDGRIVRTKSATNPTGMQGFIFNIRRPHLQDRRVREALGLLFDYEWTNRQLFNGAYTRTRSYFDNPSWPPPGCRARTSSRSSNAARQGAGRGIRQGFRTATNPGQRAIREQQRQAYRLLTEAGWKVENDQMLDAQGKPVKLEFPTGAGEFERVLLPTSATWRTWASNWRSVGSTSRNTSTGCAHAITT